MLDVSNYIKRNQYKKAYQAAYRAILKKDKTAYKVMGDLYYNGYYVLQNYEKAYEYYEKGVEALDYNAVVAAAVMLLNGNFVKRDIDGAYKLFLEALIIKLLIQRSTLVI